MYSKLAYSSLDNTDLKQIMSLLFGDFQDASTARERERRKIKYPPPPLGDGYIERLPLTSDPINHPLSERLWTSTPP